jgi:hypothetical protein
MREPFLVPKTDKGGNPTLKKKPSDECGAARKLSRGVLLPAVGRGQLQDLQPRDVDITLFRTWGGVCVVVVCFMKTLNVAGTRHCL